jgi:hypothetical protein
MLNFKYYKTTWLIVAIISLAMAIDFVLYELVLPFLKSKGIEFLRAPGNVAIIAMLLALYDSTLWKLPIFKFFVNVPNMSGRYKGKISFEFQGEKGEKNCFVEVKQSASKIKVHTYFNNELDIKTNSKSLVEDIRQEEDGFFDIYLFYLNSGNKIDSVLDCHEGANKLRYIPARKNSKSKFVGHYFTNRQVQTRGEIEVEFESKDLKGEF